MKNQSEKFEMIDAREFLFEAAIAIGDVFDAEVTHEDDAIVYAFRNGQKFRLSVAEID